MIGVKNNSGSVKDFELWVNELRLVGLDTKGGWSSYAQLNTNLADFADISLVGQTSSPGFGGIEESNSERSIEDVKQYDFSSTINLGTLLPDNKYFKLNMPFFYNISEIFKTPLYDPLRPDIDMEKSLKQYDTQSQRDNLLDIAQDYTKRTNLNIANFKIETKGKKYFFSPSNFTLSYSDNEYFNRNIDTEFFRERQIAGSIIYNHSTGAKPITPFKKIIKSDYLALIRDFNFYYLPTNFTFKIDLQRDFTEEKFRDLDDNVEIKLPINYIKKFTLNYNYGINYTIMKNLRLNYSAGRDNIIDEPEGAITNEVKDSIWKNILTLGRPTRFNQKAGISYKVPFNKIPFTKFISVDAVYNTDYQWDAAKLTNRNIQGENGEIIDLGNNIKNAQTITINGKIDFKKVYKTFDKIFKSKPKKKKSGVLDNIKNKKKGRKKEDMDILKIAGNTFRNLLFSVKDVSTNYTLNRGTILPGFLPSSGYFGRDNKSPTFGFLFGDQTDIRTEAVKRGWITPNANMLNDMFSQNETEKLNFKATLEPIKKLNINLTATKSFTRNLSENYSVNYNKNDIEKSTFKSLNPTEGGSFSMSFISIGTSFKDSDGLFRNFLDRTKKIANKKASEHYGGNNYKIVDSTGYPEGFQKTHSEVLISSFISTYGAESGNDLNIFRKIPLPNWRISYSGLMSIKWFKKYFKTFNFNHMYNSVYNVSSFQNDLNFVDGKDEFNLGGNLISKYTYGNVSLIERFSPFLGINITLKNSLSIKSDYKKDRALSLSLNNNSINEIIGDEYTFGVGYVFKDIGFIIKTKTRRKKIKSDINFKLNVSVRRNKTIIRKIVEEDFQITAGENIITIRSSADYKFSKKLILNLFYEYSNRRYEISTSYPTINTRGGINVRFNLD